MEGCREAKENLIGLVFGELDEEHAVVLNQHLASCKTCRQEEKRLLEMRDNLRDSPQAPDPALKERIRAALPKRRHRGVMGILLRPVPAYAAAAAVLLVAVLARGLPQTEKEMAPTDMQPVVTEATPLQFAIAGSYQTAPWTEEAWGGAESTPATDPPLHVDSL